MTRSGGFLLMINILIAVGCQREVRPLDVKGDLDGAPVESEGGGVQPGSRVRVAFVIDVSKSMNITDPSILPDASSYRQQAAAASVAHLAEEDAAFAFVAFHDHPEVNAGLDEGFIDDPETIAHALATFSQGKGVADFQGALSVTKKLIAEDIAVITEGELARTTYLVIFVSDGPPSIICEEGCTGEPLCDQLPLRRQCEAYNTPQSLQKLVAEIASLSKAAVIRVNTVLVGWMPEVIVESIRAILVDMATLGRGTFLEAPELSQLSFIPLLDL